MKFTLRSFHTGTQFFGDVARAMSSKLLDLSGEEDAHDLFHYTAEGKSKQGFSAIKFKGMKDGFALLGMGDEGERLIERFAKPLAVAWSVKTNHAVTQSSQSGAVLIQPVPYYITYELRSVIVQHKPHHLTEYYADQAAFLSKLLERNIRTQCAAMGIDCPDVLSLDIVDVTEKSPAHLGYGNGHLKRVDVTFKLKARLQGWWSFGFLTSRGYGLLNATFELAKNAVAVGAVE